MSMTEMLDALILLFIVVAMLIYCYSIIHIAGEYERFAVFTLGRFKTLVGPGLRFRMPGSSEKWVRVSAGDGGEMMGPSVARFDGSDLPVTFEGRLRLGTVVKVIGFTADSIQVEADPEKTRTVTCENCGHEMVI